MLREAALARNFAQKLGLTMYKYLHGNVWIGNTMEKWQLEPKDGDKIVQTREHGKFKERMESCGSCEELLGREMRSTS